MLGGRKKDLNQSCIDCRVFHFECLRGFVSLCLCWVVGVKDGSGVDESSRGRDGFGGWWVVRYGLEEGWPGVGRNN